MHKQILGWLVMATLILNICLIVVEVLELTNNLALLGLMEARGILLFVSYMGLSFAYLAEIKKRKKVSQSL